VNCAAIAESLLESELFGHEKGAFTDAIASRAGKFELASGGTLFLDEIGDMPFDLQTRLLRVLSDGHFYRVGGHSAVKAHVRVIAATHQNLEQRVKDGAFREDLFHRLNVIRLRLPALRERSEDIPTLTRHFLQQSAQQLGVEPKRISPSALEWIARFDFPGNVRQLENLCHWVTVMAPSQVIDVKDLPPEILGQASPAMASVPSAHSALLDASVAADLPSHVPIAPHWAAQSSSQMPWELGLQAEAAALLREDRQDVWDVLSQRFEGVLIQAALASTRGRRIEAAVKLGIGRNTITRKIQDLKLEDGPQGH
jgi:two-component system nitrogen regulation response regulator GlnG